MQRYHILELRGIIQAVVARPTEWTARARRSDNYRNHKKEEDNRLDAETIADVSLCKPWLY